MTIGYVPPSSFSVGALDTAPHMSLLLGRTADEETCLVGRRGETLVALSLGPAHRFLSIDCGDASEWRGIIVPGVVVEIDPTSIFDPDLDHDHAGCIVRYDDKLGVFAIKDPHRFRISAEILILVEGLAQSRERHRAAFRRWSITVGAGLEKRTLFEVSAGGAER